MDAHTHRHQHSPHLYVLSSAELAASKTTASFFCAGIHPWHVTKHSFDQVELMASRSGCVAIGETGLDRLHPNWDQQLELFGQHAELAERLQKPLVVHVVRASSDLMHYLKHHRPKMPWLWHDFTGPLEALPKLMKLHPGLYFSMGPRGVARKDFSELWNAIPANRRLLESDDSGVDIAEVFRNAGVSRELLLSNYQNLFPSMTW